MSEIFDELKKLQEEYIRLNKLGLIDISECYIQVNVDLFKEICKGDCQRITLDKRDNDPYIGLRYIKDDVAVITLI